MIKIRLFLFLTSIGFLLVSCEHTSECDCLNSSCDMSVLISADAYLNAAYDLLNIDTVIMNNDCLEIKFGSSGCDGSSWVIKLIDSGEIMESIPEQRRLRLSLKNEELCDAYFTKQFSFNVEDLKASGNSVILHIDGFEYPILYEY